MAEHRAYKAGRFDCQRLDAYAVAKEALGRGDREKWLRSRTQRP